MTRLQKLSKAVYALIDSDIFSESDKQFLIDQLATGLYDIIDIAISVTNTPEDINAAIDRLKRNGPAEMENIFISIHKNLDSYRSRIIQEYFYVEFIDAILDVCSYDEVAELGAILDSIGVDTDLCNEVRTEYKKELQRAQS